MSSLALESDFDSVNCTSVNADALLKGTNIDGIYDCQSGNSGAILDHVSFREAVSMGITSMDVMAITYCEENEIPGLSFLYKDLLSLRYHAATFLATILTLIRI